MNQAKREVGDDKAKDIKLTSTQKRTNFDLVALGTCSHDNARLGDEIRDHGVGVTRVCEACSHTWYINKKIRTCKCLTCLCNIKMKLLYRFIFICRLRFAKQNAIISKLFSTSTFKCCQ